MRARGQTVLFSCVFFLSGIAGLGYQVIWTRAFAAAIGHEFPSMLAVITAFMTGMAIGNVLMARVRQPGPSCYAFLELWIGLWAIGLTLLTPQLESVVFALVGAAPSPLRQSFVVFTVVLLALLPATAAMGATLAAAERFLTGTLNWPTTALLYGANTSGAMLGALLSAFWLMPMLGIWKSALLLAGLNLLCGVVALLVAKRSASPAVIEMAGRDEYPVSPRTIAFRLFLCGLLGLGFEVAIVRGLSQVLENTVYTFAVVLAVYLGATAIGAFLYQRFRSVASLNDLKILFTVMSFAVLLAGIALRWTPQFYFGLRSALGDSLPAVATAEMTVSALLLFVPCLCMGVTWAALAERSLRFRPNLAWAAAWNTAGAAAAPYIWGVLIIPAGGLPAAFGVIAFGYATSLLIDARRYALLVVLAAVAAVPFLTSTRQLLDTAGGQVISLQEGVMGTVAVIEHPNGSRVLKFNNRFQMGGTAARVAEERQTHIPLLLHPQPQRALLIGLGTGISFAAAAHHPGLVAEGVELVPEIAASMPLFNESGLQSTQLITHIADGRRFVRVTTNRFDVVIGDLFHPAQDGAGFLYTREHFQAIRSRLNEGGLFCQWLPLHQMDLRTIAIISATFQTVFPSAERWLLRFNVETPVIGLMGWNGAKPNWNEADLDKRIAAHPSLAEQLRATGLSDSIRLLGCYIDEVAVGSVPRLNTDADPVVLFRAPAITFRRNDAPAERLLTLIEGSRGPTGMAPKVDKFIEARDRYLQGLVEISRDRADLALQSFIESARISADFTAGYAQAITYATARARTDPESARTILEALIAAQPDRPVARELLEHLTAGKQ